MSSLLLRGGLVVTMNDRYDVLQADVSIRDGRIVEIAPTIATPHDRVIDAAGNYVLPGFVQTHIHLCQTLFRGFADDLPLMAWLRTRVWPMEAAHTPATLRASARLAAAELLAGGTTAVLTMETVHDTDAVFEAIAGTGLRATIGKCMMDADAEVPARLREPTQSSIDESLALRARWHGAEGGRLRAAFAPRFAVSCSRELLESVAALADTHQALVHTHASESREEIAIVRELSGGLTNVEYLAATGLASPHLCTAHCVWVGEREQALMAERDVKVMHCPGSNLKLGSGIAPVPEMRARGITVSLGADGAACNNRLDMFDEMRLAAVLQAMRIAPGVLPAREVVWMATRGGAKTLGLDDEIGAVEVGKRADLIVIDRNQPHLSAGTGLGTGSGTGLGTGSGTGLNARDAKTLTPYSEIVYSARSCDVVTTIVDGEVLFDAGRLTRLDPTEVIAAAREAARTLAARAGV